MTAVTPAPVGSHSTFLSSADLLLATSTAAASVEAMHLLVNAFWEGLRVKSQKRLLSDRRQPHHYPICLSGASETLDFHSWTDEVSLHISIDQTTLWLKLTAEG